MVTKTKPVAIVTGFVFVLTSLLIMLQAVNTLALNGLRT